MSLRFLADENIDSDLALGLQRGIGGIDVVRVQDVGLRTLDDRAILPVGGRPRRVLISRDIKTIRPSPMIGLRPDWSCRECSACL